MKNIIFSLILCIVISFLIISCEGDCKDERIEKVEWVTTYEDKSKDTLVSYSLIENQREYIKSYEEIKHTVTIRNNSSLYRGKFALQIDYGYYDDYSETKTKEFDYVSIAPKNSYTFTYYTQAGKYSNYNSSYTILQKPTIYFYKKRKDELKTDTIIVNSCKENVEALREKYRAIKKLYQSKVDLDKQKTIYKKQSKKKTETKGKPQKVKPLKVEPQKAKPKKKAEAKSKYTP